MFYKPETREKLRDKRKRLDPVSCCQAAQAVAAQIVQESSFLDSQDIACYLSDENELDPMPLMHAAETLNKNLYLPLLQAADSAHPKGQLVFTHYQIGELLKKSSHSVYEPATARELKPIEELDIILLPIVGFDTQGNRLGRGAGHYDRALAAINQLPNNKRPLLIGLAYEFQKVANITPDDWDIPLDQVITEKNVYFCQSTND